MVKGGCAWQRGGMHGKGGHAWQRGVCVAKGRHAWYARPPLRDTAGQCAGGTHPTGMYSCSLINSQLFKNLTCHQIGVSIFRILAFELMLMAI